MKKLVVLFAMAAIVTTGCRKIEVDGSDNSNPNPNPNPNPGGQTITLEGKINLDTVLRATNTYILKGLVYAVNNAKITIEPGTVIKGQYTNPIGGLVITRGAQLIADGNVDKPIVFTSASPTPRSGDWAGLVILGKAKVNTAFNGQAGQGEIEGGVNDADGNGLYGGTDDNDNSGIIRYVRIEYAGYAYLPDKEINSLTMGGVGSGTIIDYVQTIYAKDDAFEWFGGSVNCSHLIAYRTQDDDFDTDNGFSGKVQFGLIVRDSTVADISRSESFESDNDANGSVLTPQTQAIFSNVTSVGPMATLNNKGNSLYLGSAQVRRNSRISVFNSVFLGWPIGILIDASKGRPTDLNINDSTLRIRNSVIAGCPVPVKYAASSSTPTGANDASIQDWFTSSFFKNTIYVTTDEARLVNPFNYSNPDFAPYGTSPLASGASFTDPLLQGFKTVPFRGAIAPGGDESTWHKGWARFPTN